jgi:type I restriction enzyme S subunit
MSTPLPEVPLADIAKPISRMVEVTPGQRYRTIGVKWWGEGAYERATIDGSCTAAKTLSLVREGDLIINKIWVRHGSTAIAGADVDGCAASGEFPTFALDENRVVPRWLHWHTKTRAFWAKCDVLSQGTSGKNRIKPELFLTIRVPLPPLTQQRRTIARIEDLAIQIQEARTLRLRAAEEVDVLLGRTAEMSLADNFPQVRLEEACHIITDGTHQTPQYTDEGAIFLSAQNVKPFRFMPEKHRYVSVEDFRAYTARSKPKCGDVLLTRVGAGIGEAAVVDQDLEFAIYVSLALIRPDKKRLSPEFLVYWLNSPAGRTSSHRETLGRGHSQGNLNLKLLRGVRLPLPTLREQRRIVSKLDALRLEVDALQRLQAETATEIDALLPSVLDRAFKGEL